jgi:mitochondrial pyruvate carrier 2
MSTQRAGIRFLQNVRFANRQSHTQIRQQASRRWQSTDAAAAQAQSGFQKLWNSPVGPKTVHFW